MGAFYCCFSGCLGFLQCFLGLFFSWRSSGCIGQKLGRNEARLAGSTSVCLADGVGFLPGEMASSSQELGTDLLYHRVCEPEPFRDPTLSYSDCQQHL